MAVVGQVTLAFADLVNYEMVNGREPFHLSLCCFSAVYDKYIVSSGALHYIPGFVMAYRNKSNNVDGRTDLFRVELEAAIVRL